MAIWAAGMGCAIALFAGRFGHLLSTNLKERGIAEETTCELNVKKESKKDRLLVRRSSLIFDVWQMSVISH